MDNHVLTLFILGYTAVAKRAINNLEILCKQPEIKDRYTIKVINLYENPAYAEQEKILATPLLIINNTNRNMRIIGDLSNNEQISEILMNGLSNHEKREH